MKKSWADDFVQLRAVVVQRARGKMLHGLPGEFVRVHLSMSDVDWVQC
jgi:hypothetical protein